LPILSRMGDSAISGILPTPDPRRTWYCFYVELGCMLSPQISTTLASQTSTQNPNTITMTEPLHMSLPLHHHPCQHLTNTPPPSNTLPSLSHWRLICPQHLHSDRTNPSTSSIHAVHITNTASNTLGSGDLRSDRLLTCTTAFELRSVVPFF
jgi:hypothetical protein